MSGYLVPPHKCHRCADAAPLTCRWMTYIYSLCDGIYGQDFRTLTRLEGINRTLPNGVNAPHLEHRFGLKCSSSPSPSQSSPPFTSRSPTRKTIFLLVPYLAPKPQRTRPDAIRACLPSFAYIASSSYPTPHVAEMIQHVSVPTTYSSELRLLAWRRAVATRMLKRR